MGKPWVNLEHTTIQQYHENTIATNLDTKRAAISNLHLQESFKKNHVNLLLFRYFNVRLLTTHYRESSTSVAEMSYHTCFANRYSHNVAVANIYAISNIL